MKKMIPMIILSISTLSYGYPPLLFSSPAGFIYLYILNHNLLKTVGRNFAYVFFLENEAGLKMELGKCYFYTVIKGFRYDFWRVHFFENFDGSLLVTHTTTTTR